MNNTASSKVTLILPVRRPGKELERCLASLLSGTEVPQIIVMDCTADEDALKEAGDRYPEIRFFDLKMNPGRAHAVNVGIHITRTPYVMTMMPHIEAGKHCVEKLCEALDRDRNLLGAQAKILSSGEAGRLSGAGWILDLGAVPHVAGRGAAASSFPRRRRIAAAQMECAIYRMAYLQDTGILDERFYGRLEDLDLGIRGGLAGFQNLYEPSAVCREQLETPQTDFYRQLEAGNLVYLRYKYGLREWGLPGSKREPESDVALERGRMLCFQAEMEKMEKEELGMSVTKQTLPEEFYMEIREDGPENVYPLYLGERAQRTPADLPALLRMYAGMLAGTAEVFGSRLPV